MFLTGVLGEKKSGSSETLDEGIVLERYEKEECSNLLKILTDRTICVLRKSEHVVCVSKKQ